MVKRILLFLSVNLLVLLTISISTGLLGIRHYLSARGIDYTSLLAFCAMAGFSGALISLALSRVMAKWMMGVRVIDMPRTPAERELLQTVHRLAQRAGLPGMPQVGVYDSPEVNAFATGPSKARSLVAVSTGLLEQMDGAAVEGVLAHEVSHIANGDMVTMTLLQGVVNTFVMFFARIAAWVVAQGVSGNRDPEDASPPALVHFLCVIVFDLVFGLFGSMLVAYFSRHREFRADAGGARLGGREKMVHALTSLKGTVESVETGHAALASLKISGGARGLVALLATHPDLDDRIRALRAGT